MMSMYSINTDYNYRELVEFEKTRVAILRSHPLISDVLYEIWNSISNKVATCNATKHAEITTRHSGLVTQTPNARFFDVSISDYECDCTFNGTIMLCPNPRHKHSSAPVKLATCDQRGDADNQGIVSADVFGFSSRARWQLMLTMFESFDDMKHARLIVKTFIAAMETNDNMRKLLPCLLEFSMSSPLGHQLGKAGDKKQFDWDHSGRHEFISFYSHARERFHLFDPIALTFALLLFIDARGTVGWMNAFRLWSAALIHHCNVCPHCASCLSSSLFRITVYQTLLPILPLTMANQIENLATKIRCNREHYRPHS